MADSTQDPPPPPGAAGRGAAPPPPAGRGAAPPPSRPSSGRGGGRLVALLVVVVAVLVLVVGIAAAYMVVVAPTEPEAAPALTTAPSAGQRAGAPTVIEAPAPPSAPTDQSGLSTPADGPGTAAPTTPAPPPPTTPPGPKPADVLKRNDLYDAARIRDVDCRARSGVALDNLEHVTAYYESVMPCLRRTWRQLQTRSDIPFRPPSLVVFSDPPQTPCGPGHLYSFYCSANETIYMYADEMFNPWNQYAGDDFSHGLTKLAATHTIAHEYGHHVQHITGIFTAMGPDWPGTEVERRSELQASCLGNIFLSAQRSAYPVEAVYWDAQWEELWRFITRVPNHGSAANQKLWTDRGYESAKPGDCNTWTVGSGKVS